MADQAPPAPQPDDPPAAPAVPAVSPVDRRRGEPLLRNPQFVLAVIVTIGLFAMWGTVTSKAIPAENHDIILMLLTAVSTAWVGAMGFFFGSNMASRNKDTAIATLAAKAPAQGGQANA